MMKKWIAFALAFALAIPACALGEGLDNKLGMPIAPPTKKNDSAPSDATDAADSGMKNRLGMPLALPSRKGEEVNPPAPDAEETAPEKTEPIVLIEAPENAPAPTTAAEIDLSGLGCEELARLRDRINLAMWQSEDWQEVTVPSGVWIVGEDIPAGHWTIAAADGALVMITYGSKLDPNGREVSWESDVYYFDYLMSPTSPLYDASTPEQIDLNMTDGMYFVVSDGSVVFTPYSGKPSLGFKW